MKSRWLIDFRNSPLSIFGIALVVLSTYAVGLLSKDLAGSEAKASTASSEAFVPPPRSIDDILAILHGNAAQAETQRRQWQAQAAAQPPQGVGDTALAEFYIERAGTLAFLGRVDEQLADLNAAEALTNVDRQVMADVYQSLGWAHVHGANFRLGLEYRRRGLQLLSSDRRPGKLIRSASLASFEAYLGDYAAAESHIAEARSLEATIPGWRYKKWVGFSRAILHSSEALISMSRGRYDEAEALFLQVVDIVDRDLEAGLDSQAGSIGLGLRNLLKYVDSQTYRFLAVARMRDGRLSEAEDAARIATERAVTHFGRLSIPTAEALLELANVLLEQNRPQDAEAVAREDVAIYREMGVPKEALFYNRARVALAETLIAQSRWQEVLEIFDAIERDMQADRALFEHVISGSPSWAIAQIATGGAAAAVTRLRPAYEQRRRDLGDSHILTAETGGLLGAALVATGRAGEALPFFEQALSVFASNSRDSSEEGATRTARNLRIAFSLEAYLQALYSTGGVSQEITDKALRVAGVAQGRSVQNAVLAAAARANVQDPALAALVREEQDTRKQIGALYGALANMMSAPPDRRDASAETQLRERIDRLRLARAALSQEIERQFPDYAAHINPEPPGIPEVQGALAAGEALVATYVGKTASYVWAVPKSGGALFYRSASGEESLFSEVQRLRFALAPNARTLGEIPAFDTALASDLYQRLLEPVSTGWRDAASLLVVADGPLGQLPFGVLVTQPGSAPAAENLLFEGYKQVPWLARDKAITVLPSVSSLIALRALPPARPTRRSFAGFGDPVFQAGGGTQQATAATGAGDAVETRGLAIALRSLPDLRGLRSSQLAMLPRLPDTAEEVRSIALALRADPARDVFVGTAANERQVKTMDLSGYRIIAFATHGLVPGDLDGLTQPALALSSPQAAGVEGDGLLTMEEILALRLDADWVILSACNTGSGQGAGAEAVSGLGRAFFYAGTRALLVSNWPVETTSAKALTTDIFRRQAVQPGLSRSVALQQAMLALIDGPGYLRPSDGKALFSYAHPIFWAPFSVIGDGGATAP